MAYDLPALRAQFPALEAGLAHFEGPGGTQTPRPVIRAVADALSRPLAHRRPGTAGDREDRGDREDDALAAGARQALADLLGADPLGIVVGRSATQLTYDISRTLARAWRPGDEVVVTRLDHDANVRPWVRAAERSGATVRWADFDAATGELTPEHLAAVLSPRTRLVAVTAASNLLGTRPPVAALARCAHEAGALLYVDAVHYAAHTLVDLDALGADAAVCSPYKFLGPHHGVLAARPALLETLRPDKVLPAPDTVPERFEQGMPQYELMAGTRAAVDFLAGLDADATGTRRERLAASYAALAAHEEALSARIDKELAGLEGVTAHGRAADRTPTRLLTFDGRAAQQAHRFLAARGVLAPAGVFYAVEAARRLGLGETGGLRIGLAPYTAPQDADRLLTGLADFLRQPR
ncbi:cysteine desulfurase-like protein [Streptomyces boncukensis]|uniref:Cysteine desulfurase-like protein n=1 Tax=Streptomyces boncukensis TaxID=2711219 RepID=A0A6G4X5Y5_9ACTN|nr:cysteine desulfurase-like protein [Streptomyces boncukensis]NGO72542.1 cysteine desulfurase-like protein [Streptomyces boncukensis]